MNRIICLLIVLGSAMTVNAQNDAARHFHVGVLNIWKSCVSRVTT